MHVLLAGGGTGGHLFPGIALAQGLRAAAPSTRITFLCTDRALDAAQLPRYGLSGDVLPAPRLTSWRSYLAFPFAFYASVRRAMRVVKERRPDAVVALGGYGGAPAVRAAAALGVPAVLLEQNVIPGRANRYTARSASRIFTQWPESVPRFGRHAAKVEVTGNPVREEIARRDAAEARRALGLRPDLRTLLVIGGSQGAAGINRGFLEGADLLGARRDRLQVMHLAGEREVADLREAYARAGVAGRVEAFWDDMASALSAADFAVSRAGGTSIAELAVMGLPAVLVPYPRAADNHQWYNAEAAAKGGGAVAIEESELVGPRLRQVVDMATADAAVLQNMAARMRALGRPDARQAVAERVLSLGG